MTSIRMLALVSLSVLPQTAAERPGGVLPPTQFWSESALVLVPVTVTDDRGGAINGLSREVFSVFDNKAPQRIVAFSEQDIPVSLGIVLDLSGSMKDGLREAKEVLRALLRDADPEDEALLLSVSDRPSMRSGFTGRLDGVVNRLLFAKASGSTALVDTVYVGLSHMRDGRNARKALVVISDGMDNHSRYSKGELMSAAVESGVSVHSIAIQGPQGNRKPVELIEERRGLAFLSDLAERTGGLNFVVQNGTEIDGAARAIGKALRNQYVLGYRPETLHKDGRWHVIRVKLALPKARVYARPGYYSP